MKFHDSEETPKSIYLLCEYCDCGDLERDQMKQNNRVYKLQDAIEILADVIKGL